MAGEARRKDRPREARAAKQAHAATSREVGQKKEGEEESARRRKRYLPQMQKRKKDGFTG
jgi:hypothetical protein